MGLERQGLGRHRRGAGEESGPLSIALDRFVKAQAGVIDRALAELRAGRKQSHWMWFVFPQIEGLGFSAMSQRFAISGLEEARAYLAHPLLGPRLRECTQAVLDIEGRDAHTILGGPDDMKFHSCMTLFDRTAPHDIFRAALEKYFGGEADPRTIDRLS